MSDFFKLYDVNLVDQAKLTVSSENALFPLSNILDSRASKVFRSNSSNTNIVLDFQESAEINGIFILPNKRDGFGFSSVTVEFSHTSDFASPAYSKTISFSETLEIGYASFDTISYRFCRIVMTSSLPYCELSNIFIGKDLGLNTTINFGWTYKNEELSQKSYNRYGQQFTDVISRQKVLGFSFKLVSKEDIELINVMLDRVGETKPFYISIGANTMSMDFRRYSGCVFLTDTPTISNSSFARYNLSMTVKEAM